jgi:acyl-CoA synthetase (AMP-forming)/AMP-acid ligase II
MNSESFVSILTDHAINRADERALIFINSNGKELNTLTYSQLDHKARLLANSLAQKAKPGDRALLMYPPGNDFFVGFFACLYAGIIAVPALMPRRGKLKYSTISIVENCEPQLVLTSEDSIDNIAAVFESVPSLNAELIATDQDKWYEHGNTQIGATIDHQTVAFLQYTSGSTSNPKGVIVNHGNLIANLDMIAEAYELTSKSTRIGWVPHYHDLGLIFNTIQGLHVGALCVVMAPLSFVQHPWTWLNAIDTYKAEIVMAPNSAYDTCVDFYRAAKYKNTDLSSLKLAVNAAEPVRAATMARFTETFAKHGFKMNVFHPGFGMAEATLVVTGGRFSSEPVLQEISDQAFKSDIVTAPIDGEKSQIIVGCGLALPRARVAIVDPKTNCRLPSGRVGEVWVNGAHTGQGYWQNQAATIDTFKAKIDGEDDSYWLRTGDLGCLNESGELFITGRMKDVIIIRGENYYPQDIEFTAETSHDALRRSGGAAFVIEQKGTSKVVLVFEVKRSFLKKVNKEDVLQAIKMAVVQEHGLSLHDIALVRTGMIPKTTSGKIRRAHTKDLWFNQELDYVEFGDETASETS